MTQGKNSAIRLQFLQARSRENQQLFDKREYEYDAFVMHCHADSQWVIHQLRPHLEESSTDEVANLRLCIHQRDWLGGRDITDNIVESIEASRKSLLIVSNAFAASSWCQFELTMAQTRLFEEDRDNLILFLLEEIAEVIAFVRNSAMIFRMLPLLTLYAL